MTITRVYKSHLLNTFIKPRLNTCKVCTLVTLYTCTVLKKHVSITHTLKHLQNIKLNTPLSMTSISLKTKKPSSLAELY